MGRLFHIAAFTTAATIGMNLVWLLHGSEFGAWLVLALGLQGIQLGAMTRYSLDAAVKQLPVRRVTI